MTFRFSALAFGTAVIFAAGQATALTGEEYNALIQKQSQQQQILDGEEPKLIEPASVQTPPPSPTPAATAAPAPPPLPSDGLGGAGLLAAGLGVAVLIGVGAVALGGGGGDSASSTGTD